MRKQASIILVCLLIAASLAGCGDYARLNPNGSVDNEPPGGIEITDEIDLRERLMAMGHSDTELNWMIDNGISLERIYNEIRFGKFADRINSNQPIGSSGEVILSEYYGGIYYDDEGILTVIVLEEAFNHAASAIAITEMKELGIIVRTARFTDRELYKAIDTLNRIAEDVAAAGASYWSLDTKGNRIIVGLDPFTDEQKAAFLDLLFSASVDPAMIAFKQAVTQEMIDQRAEAIASATQSAGERILLVGDVEVSCTGIAFSLENRADSEFHYGEPWDLACYIDGNWTPVPNLPRTGWTWTSMGYSLQSGGVKQYRQEWARRFGELSPGRYMYIRDGWLGEWQKNHDAAYALVEFYITEDSPETLSAQRDEEQTDYINLVAYSDVTPKGMSVVIENASKYDIENSVQIVAIVHEKDALSEDWFDWKRLDLLPIEGDYMDYLIQGKGFLPSGGQLGFRLDWEAVYGELSPGDYRIVLSPGGRAYPPHPTGWAFNANLLVISFTVLG